VTTTLTPGVGSGAGGISSQVAETYDLLGNQTSVKTYDFGTLYGGVGPLLTSRSTNYLNVADVFEAPQSVTDESGALTLYFYDQSTPQATSGVPQHIVGGNAAHLNLTTVMQPGINANRNPTVGKYTYYDTGKVMTAANASGAVTTYTYGQCASAFPTGTSTPVSSPTGTITATLITSASYDCVGGLPTSMTDVNGNVASTTYSDPMWRQTSTVDILGNTTTVTYPTASSNTASLTKTYKGGLPGQYQLTKFDGLQRPILQQSQQGPNSTTYTSVASMYDIRGNLSWSSIPYTASAGTYTTSGPGSQSTYDALGRPWNMKDAGGGTVGYTYNLNDVLVTSGPIPAQENSKARQLEYNGAGQLASVCEVTAGVSSGSCGQSAASTGYLTTYSYSGSLLKAINQNVQTGASAPVTHTFSYDSRSRLSQQVMPETGTTTFTYDLDSSGTCAGTFTGSIVKSVDNAGNVTCFTYDTIQRQLSSSVLSGPYASVTPNNYFVYDAATYGSTAMQNAIGTLAEAYTCTAPCTSGTKLTDVFQNSYPEKSGGVPTGRTFSQTWESTAHSGGYFETQSIAGANGAISNLTASLNGNFFGFPALSYGMDSWGRVSTLKDTTNNLTLVTSTVYTPPTGVVTGVTYGNGDTDVFNYDPIMGRPSLFASAIGGSAPLSLTGKLTWNSNGSLQNFTLTDSTDSAKNQNCGYHTDDLNRLSSVSCTNPSSWAQSFTYDPLGNITKSAPASPVPGQITSTYQPGIYTAKNQVPLGSPVQASYDANGNQTAAEGMGIQWNANGQPKSINGVNATYDALGRMVETGSGSVYSEFVFDLSGNKLAITQAGKVVKGTVNLPGGGTAIYGSTGLKYLRHTDWLGSSRLATTWTHGIYSKEAYAPFGEPYNEAGTPDRSFTGEDQDTIAGQYDFLFRRYDPTAGRWLSPDPSALQYADLTNPQSFNLYSYARNNPLLNIDSNGLECVWDDGSYDASDDPETGNPAGCAAQGGNYVSPLQFETSLLTNGQYANIDPGSWSSKPNSTIASSWNVVQATAYSGDIPLSGDFTFNMTSDQFISMMQTVGISPSPIDDLLYKTVSVVTGDLGRAGTNMRDSNPTCSIHVIISPGSGVNGSPITGTFHIDEYNPFTFTPAAEGGPLDINGGGMQPTSNFIPHITQDVIPDIKIKNGTGTWTGNQNCISK
jgi:RHS repeat-associated protein